MTDNMRERDPKASIRAILDELAALAGNKDDPVRLEASLEEISNRAEEALNTLSDRDERLRRTLAEAHLDLSSGTVGEPMSRGASDIADDLLEDLDMLDPARETLRRMDPENPMFDEDDPDREPSAVADSDGSAPGVA